MANSDVVLVGVLKTPRDQKLLLRRHWYRVPVEFLPKRKFQYIAFYQPAIFGVNGKRIEYYGKIRRRKVCRRIELLPNEPNHPRANDLYVKFEFSKINKLPRPVKNIIPRRISFGFTTLKRLFSAHNILQLYGVPSIEQIISGRLKSLGIKAMPQFPISVAGHRFRLDFAIIHDSKRIAIECDNTRAHASKAQKLKDKIKNTYLRRAGWRVVRLKEKDNIERLDSCVRRIQKAIN